MRIALVAALALSLCANAKPGHCRTRACERGRGYYQSGPAAAILFSWLTSSTTWDTAQELCDAVPVGKKTGNYWCQKGDGRMDAAGVSSVTKVGTVATLSKRFCPNGATCAAKSGQYFDNQGHWKLTTTTSQSVDTAFTVCSHVAGAIPSLETNLVSRSKSTGYLYYLSYTTTGTVTFGVSDTAGAITTTTYAMAGPLFDAPHLLCATYQAVGAGTSVAKIYVDGALVTTKSTLPSSIGFGSNLFHAVGGYLDSVSTSPWANIYGTAYIPSVLDDTEQATLYADLIGSTLIADTGTNPVYTATSPTACAYDDTSVIIAPKAVPCIRNSGVEIWEAATNLFARSTDIAASPWAAASGGSYTGATTTARFTAAPNGVPSAARLVDASGAAYAGRQQTVAATTATKYTFSCYVAGAVGGETIRQELIGTGNGAGDTVCTDTVTTAYERVKCATTSAYGAGLTNIRAIIALGDTVGATPTAYVWGCQLEEGATPSPLIVSYSAATTRAAPTLSAAGPWAVANSPALAVDFTPGRLQQYMTPVYVYDNLTSGAIIQAGVYGDLIRYYADNAGAIDALSLLTPNTQYHLRGYTVGTTNNVCQDGVCASTPGSGASASYNTLDIGTGFSSLANACGLVKNICLSNAETLCP